ncbi:porin [Pararobbsia silviterrae]|uniref:Porin n=1 Tax=Pararobbsia silviterrae TaxID=1792498 RepID=A0A494Y6L4_9BURK|nr:porin [Pararobbsia silviterrae]RKP57722.1 porin [Pararobbsia silviterrae]
MKKTVVAFVASGLAGFVSVAYADGSVNLYGVIDVGLDFTNNSGGGQLWHMQDGTYDGEYGSRWGLKGNEDLGGGLQAIFQLENGFNLPSGEAGQGQLLFGRQAWVGLKDDKWGTLTIGRQYDSVIDYYGPTTMVGSWGGVNWHGGDLDNIGMSFRVDNAIKYASPNIAGVNFGGMVAFSNSNAADTSAIALWGAGANYSLGNLKVAAAYLYVKDPASFLGGDYMPTTQGSAIGATGAWSYVGQPSSTQTIGLGATYAIGNGLIAVDYSNVKFDDANGTTSTVKFSTYELWGQYKFGAATSVALGYELTAGDIGYSDAKPKYHEINFITDYALSKSTNVYFSAAYEIAAGAGQPADIFEGVTGTASTTNHQLATRVGMIHKF